MHAASKTFQHLPPAVSRVLATLEGLVAAFAWALTMHRECEHWSQSGRRLDGDAIRQIAEKVDRMGRA